MFLFLCQYHIVLITLAIQGLLCFRTNFRINCCSSVKNVFGILNTDCIESVDGLGVMLSEISQTERDKYCMLSLIRRM